MSVKLAQWKFLLVSAKLAHTKIHGIPWNSMELLVSAKLAHPKFHGIPGNCSCQQNWCTPSSLEFHGTAGVIEIGALLVPCNSMELLVSSKLAPSKFHGIPWNCPCHRNWRTWISIEFYWIPWNCSSHRNWRTLSFMEFHETARVIEIGALLFP